MLRIGAAVVLWLVTATHAPVPLSAARLQASSPGGILRVAAAKIRPVEPEWTYMSPVCNYRIQLDGDLTAFECGTWRRRADCQLPGVDVVLYVMSSAATAARWLQRPLGDGWTSKTYDIGDGGYASSREDGRGYTIHFRKGRLIIDVSALSNSKADVERFAKHLVATLSDAGQDDDSVRAHFDR